MYFLCITSLLILIKLFTIKFRNYNMSKSLSFIILALLLVASTEKSHVSSTSTGQESNSAISPDSDKCFGLTPEECYNKYHHDSQDYIIIYNP